MAAQREREVAYTNLGASDHARFHAGDNYNNYNYNYTLRQRRSDETLHASDRHRVFIQAVVEGQVPRVLHFLRMGVDLDETGSSDLTALHRAVLSGHQDLLKPLIDAGADVNAFSLDFGTPLCLAALKGMDEAVQILLQSKAKASIVTEKLGSALHCCLLSSGEHQNTAIALKDAGAKVSTRAGIDTRWMQAVCAWDGDDRTPIASLEQLDGCFLSDATPAFLAIRTLQEELLEPLLPPDLDCNFTIEFFEGTRTSVSAHSHRFVRNVWRGPFEPNYRSSEHTYIDSCATIGQLDLVKVLVAKGAALESHHAVYPPLASAACHGRTEVVKYLIESGANLDIEALHEAAWSFNHDIIRILCEHGVSVNSRDTFGDTPLHRICSFIGAYHASHHTRALLSLQALLEAGAEINARDKDGYTPLLLILLAGSTMDPHYRERTLRAGEIVDPRCKDGMPWLDVQTNDMPFNDVLLESLIHKGADTRIRAKNGTSVLRLCMSMSMKKPTFMRLGRALGFEEAIVDKVYFSIGYARGLPKIQRDREVELIFMSAQAGHEHLRLLTLMGANLDTTHTVSNWTAMHFGASRSDCVVLDRLLDAGASMQPYFSGSTPLAIAVTKGRFENAQKMLSRGGDAHAKCWNAQSALDIALERGDSKMISLLLKAAESYPVPI